MGDIVKTVDRAEFEKRRKEHLSARQCPICGGGIKLIVEFHTEGTEKVIFQCGKCGYSIKKHIPTECYSCENSFGTFKTANSIGRAILSLVEQWDIDAKFRREACEVNGNV